MRRQLLEIEVSKNAEFRGVNLGVCALTTTKKQAVLRHD